MLKKILILLLLLAAGLGLLLLTSHNSRFEVHHSLQLNRAPEHIWPLLADVDGWQNWWPGVERSALLGPLAAGSRIDLKFKGLPSTDPVRLETLSPLRRLGWSGPGVLGSTVETQIELRKNADGCEVILSNSITGPQAVLARISGSEKFTEYQQLVLKVLERRLQEPAAAKPGGEKD